MNGKWPIPLWITTTNNGQLTNTGRYNLFYAQRYAVGIQEGGQFEAQSYQSSPFLRSEDFSGHILFDIYHNRVDPETGRFLREEASPIDSSSRVGEDLLASNILEAYRVGRPVQMITNLTSYAGRAPYASLTRIRQAVELRARSTNIDLPEDFF